MNRVRPLRDRILCVRLPAREPSMILKPDGDQQSTRISGVEFRVVAVGKDVREVSVGEVIAIPSEVFVACTNTHRIDLVEYFFFHENDVSAVLEEL